jgi:DNA-directed RNA polymerase subunit RPC12/RpoP
MEYKEKPKIEILPYKCSNCGLTFPFEEMIPIDLHFGNGSVLTYYFCQNCSKTKLKS